MTGRSGDFRRLASAVLLAIVSTAALAQDDYPSHAIKMIIPLAPGGGANTVPRIIAEKLSTLWGHPVIVENRPGAALNIGAEAAAKAAPDGYTLLSTPPGPLVTNQALYSKLGYDPAAFVPITILAKFPFVLVVRSSLPVSTLEEFVAYAKANPDMLTFGSSGLGSPPHLVAEMLKARAGISFRHVQYRGLTPALNDVVAGHIDMMLHGLDAVLPFIQDGKLKAIGIGSQTRISELPNVSAFSEIYPGFLATSWYGLVGPPKMQTGIATKLSFAIAEALRAPDVAKMLQDSAMTPGGTSPAETAAFLKEETARWGEVISAAGIKLE
jgi:tripartite-type tricarboxylate transporter receptor subunit TctC